MKAVKAKFDGRQIVLPREATREPPGEVIVIFPGAERASDNDLLAAQERALHDVWDNDEDADYDKL